MPLIERLSPEREAELPAIRDYWIRVGLQTGPGDPDRAWAGICLAYTIAGLPPPKLRLWMQSPLAMTIAAAQVRDQVSAQVYAQVSAQVRDQVHDQVSEQVYAQVRSLWYLWWCPGQFDSYWLSWVDALREYCDFEHIRGLSEVAHSCAFAWAHPSIVIFCAPPTIIARNARGQLHADGSPAMLFADGLSVWMLNGVHVSQRIAETPKADIPVSWWAEENNVEIRHEIERKIGSERLLSDLDAKTIHADIIAVAGTDHPYEVQEIVLPNGDRRRLLAMTNPSTGDTHREWVPPDIQTCREALSWRNGTDEILEALT